MSKQIVSTFRHVWAAPTAIALACLLGLVVALLGDGIEDWIGWVGLTIPLAVIVWALARSKRGRSGPR